MRALSTRLVALLVALSPAVPAVAGNTLVAAGQPVAVARSTLRVTPAEAWNRLGARPGPHAETWTLDGDPLDAITFYGGIESGRPLFREIDRRERPLPHASTTLLITDIPVLLERSYRVGRDITVFGIDSIEPMRFAGRPGVRFTYSYSRPGETLVRRGEARGAVVGGRLYLMTYEAPRLHFFDHWVAAFRRIADSARLDGG